MNTQPKYTQSGIVGALPGEPWMNTVAVDGTAQPFVGAPVGQEYLLKDMTNNRVKRYRKAKADSLTNDWVQGFHCITRTVSRSDFTDGGGTSGTYVLAETIPVGAWVLRTILQNVTGFTGDTSATITVGDGSAAARYNAGTPSIFTTANAIDLGAPSGTLIHTAAATITLTVTSAADFTNVAAGSLTIRLWYLL